MPEKIELFPPRKKRNKFRLLLPIINISEIEQSNQEKTTISSMGNKIKQLEKGEMFGINAILSKKGIRSASIFANVNCDFIILLKRDYLHILTTFNKEKRDKLKFIIQKIPHMSELALSTIFDDYFYMFKTEYFLKNDILTKEGAAGIKIYFIADGFCAVNKVVEIETFKNTQKLITSCNIAIGKFGPGTIAGEELIFEKSGKYKYTITVFAF